MAYRGFTGRLPIAAQGFTGTKNQSQVGPGHLIHVEGVELEGGVINKDGGASKLNNPPDIGELLDSFTKILMHFDALDATVIFVDSNGVVNRAWTAVGNAQIDAGQVKFGISSALFDGTGDRITTPDSTDFVLGTGDWTIDLWFNVNAALGTDGGLFGSSQAPYAPADLLVWLRWMGQAANLADGRLQCIASTTSQVPTIHSSTQFSNTINPGWHHVAFVRIGTSLKLFIDGVQEGGTVTGFSGSINNLAASWAIGDIDAAGINSFNGWIDEVRFSVGVARWGTTQTNVNGADQFTKILLHLNGPDAGDQFGDDHVGGTIFHVWTPVGNAQIDTAESKFGGASMLCDGTGDGITITDNVDFTLGSGSWTFDIWFNCTATGGSARRIFGQTDVGVTNANTSIRVFRTTGNVIEATVCVGSTAFTVTGTTQFTNLLNTGWHHLAVIREMDDLKLYIDGVQQGSSVLITGSINDSSQVFGVGLWADTADGWQGWLDEFRLSVGIARWTGSFTPPGAAYGGQSFTPPIRAYEDLSVAPSDAIGVDLTTRALLHGDGTDAATTFLDSSALPNIWTAQGNAQVDTAQSRFGGASILFDGTGDRVATPDSPNFSLGSGNWTVDLWFRCDAAGATTERMVGQADAAFAAADSSFQIIRSSANVIVANVWDGVGQTSVTGTTQFTNAVNVGWHHVAFVRHGNLLKLFIDGVQEGGDVSFSGTIPDSTEALTLGDGANTTSDPWTGWLDEFRLSVGVARWTKNFTPPTAPYVIAGVGVGTPTGILSGINWSPVINTNRDVIYLNGGIILKDDGTGSFPILMEGGLGSPFDPTPVFVPAGGEDVGQTRKLFCFTSGNLPRIAIGDANTFAAISTPPADWSASIGPTAGVLHQGRMFAFGNSSDPHRVYYSSLTNHQVFTGAGTGTLPIFPGEGERLAGGISFRGSLILFKYPAGVYVVSTPSSDPVDWRVDRLTKAIGSVNQHCIVQIENDVAFLDRGGNVQLLSATNEFGDVNTANLSETADMPPFLRTDIERGTPLRSIGSWYADKRQLWYYMCRTSSIVPNLRQVTGFAGLQQQQQTGAPPRFFFSRRDEARALWMRPDDLIGVGKPVIGDDDGYIWLLDQAARNKDGVAYPFELSTGHMDLQFIDPTLATKTKNGQFLEIVNEPRGNWDLTVDVFWDGKFTQTILYDMGGAGGTLGSFVLDTDTLGGDAPNSQRRRLEGSGRRLRLAAHNAGLDQDISLAEFYVSFTTGDERDSGV